MKIRVNNRIFDDTVTGNKIRLINYDRIVNNESLWEASMMALLRFLGISNNNLSSVIYKYMFHNFDLKTHKLRMGNEQIQHNIGEKIGKHISLHSVVNAVLKLENLYIVNNSQPFLDREQYGKYGKHSYFLLNPIMLPRDDTSSQGVSICFNTMDSYHDFLLNKKIKEIDYLRKKINPICKKLKKVEKQCKELKHKKSQGGKFNMSNAHFTNNNFS